MQENILSSILGFFLCLPILGLTLPCVAIGDWWFVLASPLIADFSVLKSIKFLDEKLLHWYPDEKHMLTIPVSIKIRALYVHKLYLHSVKADPSRM